MITRYWNHQAAIITIVHKIKENIPEMNGKAVVYNYIKPP
jgi:hypothetical protein